MAENDKIPLLLEENEEIEEPTVFVQTRPDGIQKMASVQSELLDLSNEADPTPKRRRYYRHNREIVVAIFIVAFDTKKG